MSSTLKNLCPGEPLLTEDNLGTQAGKVFIVTGANTGLGKELTKILYSKHAKVYVAARSEAKAKAAIEDVRALYPASKGDLAYLHLDLNDLTTIKKSADDFLAQEQRLDVLWNNAGVVRISRSCFLPFVAVSGAETFPFVIATKASDAVPQVDRLRRYLSSSSTVAFAQNGMCKLWPPLGHAYVRARFPDGASPNWIACVTTHGVTSQGPFKSTHASPADALVGPVMPSSASRVGEEQMGYLMRQIADAPDLDARQVSRKELWIAQLEKLVVNATINPLTAVLRCKNGELLVSRDDALPAVIDKLLSEASEALSALILDPKSDGILLSGAIRQGATSETSDMESLKAGHRQLLERFSFPRLRKMVLDVGAKVSANTSSMLQDVRAGKPTEIDDFNGWLVDTAMLLNKGLLLPTHEKLIALVKSQTALTRVELCTKLLGESHCQKTT
ncbi:hypothetical protein O1611_g8790 [Lasiodiplodia mahajangana]|uniref:Uncharacterized protein n=1 Tax=Lasiodiplodia mahajangana TaxID=1108764 RepID=A0ACC2JBJ4_9PEZI|nr:hypothetical protein O1611_g8790 [Lasiodiplodia mahajangana]